MGNTSDRSSKQKKQQKQSSNDVRLLLQWRVHLALKRPIGTAISIVAIALTVYIGSALLNSLLIGCIGGVVLLCMLSDFLFPVVYRLDEEGAKVITLFGQRTMAWEEVKAYYIEGDGIVLSPCERPSPIGAFRTLYLRFDGNEKEVLKVVKMYTERKNEMKHLKG
ncbi:MAG: hypothetical protein RUDDFDWM_000782 [Candidatus Fervidibacterota bacterium]